MNRFRRFLRAEDDILVRFNLNPERNTLLAAMLLWREFGGDAIDADVNPTILVRVPHDLNHVREVVVVRLVVLRDAVREWNVQLGETALTMD